MNENELREHIKNYMNFLENKLDMNDIIQNMSISSQITHSLKKNRQNILNIKETIILKKYKVLQDETIVPINFEWDNNYIYAKWNFKFLVKEKFEHDNKLTIIKLGEVKTFYTFIKTLETNNFIKCQNCGHEVAKANNSFMKCSYCQTIINDDDLKIKLANFNIWRRDKHIREGEKYIIIGIIIMVLSMSLLFPISIALMMYGFKTANKLENENNKKENNIISSLQKFNNQLSIENLKDNIINKVKQIHYCINTSQLSYFINTNINNHIDNYQSVISTNIVSSRITNFRTNNNLLLIDFNLILNVFIKENNKIIEKFEEILITVAKENNDLSSYYDSQVFKCNNCGSNNIDLVLTGKCNHCKSGLDWKNTIKYDWVIFNYQAQYINYKNN